MRPHAAGAPLHEAGARMVLTAARPWFGQQAGVRVLGLRAFAAATAWTTYDACKDPDTWHNDDPGGQRETAAMFSSHRPVLPVSMALQENQVEDDDEWMVAFEADLVAALNHPTQGIRGLPNRVLVVDANDVAVGR